MSNSDHRNPLLSPQRETAGASTYEKYEYQYHWALFRALKEYEQDNEYVIFVELHEDVVMANSLSNSEARFEFNQIKNISGSAFSLNKITKREKSNRKLKNSIIGKMLIGIEGKPFKEKIDQINLVATCGFSLSLKDPELKLNFIKVDDLHEDCIKAIEESLSDELGTIKLPTILSFIKPELPAHGFQHFMIGQISELVENKIDGASCSATNIYRVLMDDLRRKGAVTYDYSDWDLLLRAKGLTSKDVARVTSKYIQIKDLTKIEKKFNEIVIDLGLHSGKKTKLERAFGHYQTSARFTKSPIQLEISKHLKELILEFNNIFEEHGPKSFIDTVSMEVREDINKHFSTRIELEGAIIYELIMSNL